MTWDGAHVEFPEQLDTTFSRTEFLDMHHSVLFEKISSTNTITITCITTFQYCVILTTEGNAACRMTSYVNL